MWIPINASATPPRRKESHQQAYSVRGFLSGALGKKMG
jgi:hypothetical protein